MCKENRMTGRHDQMWMDRIYDERGLSSEKV